MARRVRNILLSILWSLVIIAVIVAGAFAFTQRQVIQDHFAAAEFEPTLRVDGIVQSLHLTDAGLRIFLASQPTVEGRETFNLLCSRSDHSDGGHLLGCYTSGAIHLFEVEDARLAGVVEVTAAHELLHAAYGRLTQPERESLAERLRTLYAELAETDSEFAERMSVYEHLSAAAFANELHSVFGTELRDLPDWLEEHYSKWFVHRSAIVDLFDSYHEVFVSIQEEAELLEGELIALREEIERESAEYTQSVEQFNLDWDSFRERNNAFEFSDNPDEFYRLQASFEDRRHFLDDWRLSLESRVNQHETLRHELELLGELSSELNEQIDSEFTPPTPE